MPPRPHPTEGDAKTSPTDSGGQHALRRQNPHGPVHDPTRRRTPKRPWTCPNPAHNDADMGIPVQPRQCAARCGNRAVNGFGDHVLFGIDETVSWCPPRNACASGVKIEWIVGRILTMSPSLRSVCASVTVIRSCDLNDRCSRVWSPKCSTRCTKLSSPSPCMMCSGRSPIWSRLLARHQRHRRQHIDARLPQSAGRVDADRIFIDVARAAELNQFPVVQDADMGRHGHCFGLIVGDIKHRRAGIRLNAFQLDTQIDRSLASSELSGSSIR